ncbi:MAG: TIGR02281 family clan AA aspartic protease [Pseudomonas sp.]
MRLTALLLVLVATTTLGAPRVEVKGLFAGRAVLAVDGRDHLLRAGESSPEGVLLVSSTSREAIVEIDGVRTTLSLSRQIAGSFVAPSEPEQVRIARSPDSHYRVAGTINGKAVMMMVDTGATALAMNARDARQLGIDYRSGARIRASTAGGMVDSYAVTLARVSVGGIVLHNVRGTVVEGSFPEQILLGNSFLSRVSMSEEAGMLVLRGKF